MQKKTVIKVLPSEAADESVLKSILALACSIKENQISGFEIIKKSIDARSKQPWVHLTVNVFIDEPFKEKNYPLLQLKHVEDSSRKVIIIGAGPAGLFAALQLLEKRIQPIIIERGKDVRLRRRDLASINKKGIINKESNYCFGEGGAGTYSDGKLYTRSTKRGDVNRILQILVQFGAEKNILYDAHPHIGTNKLPAIITKIRETIIEYGGKVYFNKKLSDFIIEKDSLIAIQTEDGDIHKADSFILATGHSARDVYTLLYNKKIYIESKPFALGVRVEHPQILIDNIQYHCNVREEHLPPASYSIVEQVNGKGVFSFCMCPGGIIAPAATDINEIVVNGWSPSKRNNPFANSGIVVAIDERDYLPFEKYGALAAMEFQRSVEYNAFISGGGYLQAPAQRLVDFSINKSSSSLPDCSYLPGLQSANLKNVLPQIVNESLKAAFIEYGKKLKGYYTNEAVVVATESRTSSPVRIPRNKENLMHVQIKNLYPCGEGAGYAGGIVSAAMDGIKVAEAIAAHYNCS
ncbi:MAG TPA: FAD-binding protein [Flavisolibacter sp.]|jgi:hypothetical protein|nr:FAD-binding protein [Flavisolibacter sp.]